MAGGVEAVGGTPRPRRAAPGRSLGRVVVESQGHLFRARVEGRVEQRGGGKRGRVCGFSRKARKRFLESFARLDTQVGALFVTLTLRGELVAPSVMKHWLAVLFKRLRRAYPWMAAHWRFGMESEGEREYNPHFHLVIYNVSYIPVEWIRRVWGEVIGRGEPHVWVQGLESWRKGMAYCAKYVGKLEEQASLDYLTYLTGEAWTGRMWGVFNRKNLPLAELIEVALAFGDWFFSLKRSARRAWPGVNDYRWAGFSLFRKNPDQWLGLLLYYAGQPGE